MPDDLNRLSRSGSRKNKKHFEVQTIPKRFIIQTCDFLNDFIAPDFGKVEYRSPSTRRIDLLNFLQKGDPIFFSESGEDAFHNLVDIKVRWAGEATASFDQEIYRYFGIVLREIAKSFPQHPLGSQGL